MREYEFIYVVQPEISDEGVTAISERFEGILAENGSEKLFYEDWGRRRLAYEIRNFQKGHYRVLHFLSDGQVVPALERSARLDDSVLRFLTVQVSDEVADLDARRGEAAGLEEDRIKRAAERAQREAEEAAREEAERAERLEAASASAEDDDDSDSDDDSDDDDSDKEDSE